MVVHSRKMGRHRQGHFRLNDVQPVLPKTVAKSTACLSYVNDPRAFAAQNTTDQLAGDARKKNPEILIWPCVMVMRSEELMKGQVRQSRDASGRD